MRSTLSLTGPTYRSDVLLSKLGDFSMRVILSWSSSDKSVDQRASNRDLDLFVEFKASNTLQCSVGFFNPVCEGVMGNFDAERNQTVPINAETVTFKALGNHQYIIYVGEYLNKYSLSQPEI